MEPQILSDKIDAFVKAFKSIGAGDLADQTAENMVNAVKATIIEGKKSTVTIKLEISKASDEMVVVSGFSTATLPKAKPSSSFFIDGMTHLLSRERPTQTVMDFDRGAKNDR